MLLAARCLAALTLAVVAVLFVTAGELVQAGNLLEVHGGAAIALHVTTGLLTLTLAALARQRGQGWGATAVALALFAYSFLQAYLGEGPTLAIHVPGALLVAGASVWLVFWLFARQRSAASASSSAPVRSS
jgi:hypothetical protein